MKILSIILASMLVGSAYGIAQEAPAPKQDQKPLITENQRPHGPMMKEGQRGPKKPAKFCSQCGQPIMKKGPMKGGPRGPMNGQGFRGGSQQGPKGPRGPMMNGTGPRSGGPNCPVNK